MLIIKFVLKYKTLKIKKKNLICLTHKEKNNQQLKQMIIMMKLNPKKN